jgi:hypothetical protein
VEWQFRTSPLPARPIIRYSPLLPAVYPTPSPVITRTVGTASSSVLLPFRPKQKQHQRLYSTGAGCREYHLHINLRCLAMDQKREESKQTSITHPFPTGSHETVSTESRASHPAIIFMGAPSRRNIDQYPLLDTIPPNGAFTSLCSSPTPSDSIQPNWRILHPIPKRLKSGITQYSYPPTVPTSSNPISANSTSTNFYFSYGNHHFTPSAESIENSYRLQDSDPDPELDTFIDGSHSNENSYSFVDDETFLTGSDLSVLNQTQDPHIPPLISLTDLEDIPAPSLVVSRPPNPLRLTALVGILSIAPPRTVKTKFGRIVQVVSLYVGDPTHAPFRIDAWLPPYPKSHDEMQLKATVQGLRVQDIIVVKNLRLGVWNEMVFGATSGVGNFGGIELWLVHRVRCIDDVERRRWRRRWDESLLAERKMAAMVNWVKDFVDPAAAPKDEMTNSKTRLLMEILPQDTPRRSY